MEETPQSKGLVPVDTEVRPPARHEHHPHFGAGAPLEEVDIRGALRVLWRRKLLLVGTIALVTGLAWWQVSRITPTYVAQAFVVLGPQKTNLVDIEDIVSDIRLDRFQIQTEVRTLETESLASNVVEKLDLMNDPEFNWTLRPSEPGKLSRLIPWAKARMPGASDEITADQVALGYPAEFIRQDVVEAVRARSGVSLDSRGSYVVTVAFSSEDPSKAALIANTFAETYIERQRDAKLKTAREGNEYLRERVEKLRERMLVALAVVEEFRVSSGVVTVIAGGAVTLTNQQIAEINLQLIIARAERDTAAARLQAIVRGRGNQRGAESSAEVLDSPIILRLKDQEAALLRDEADLATTYGDRHPKMIEIRARIRDLQGRLQLEVARIVERLRKEVNIADVRVASLESSMTEVTAKNAAENSLQIRLSELERQAEADREIYQLFLTRFKETSEQIDFQQADARIISAAIIPRFPSAPNRSRTVGLALVASTLLGLFLVLVREKLVRGIHTAEELERNWGARVIGIVPDFQESWFDWLRSARRSHDRAAGDPVSAYAESIQQLRTHLYLSSTKSRLKVILFTSAVPKEGKTTVSESYAKMAAASGQTTIHVDCDLRRGDIKRRFGSHTPPGLAEVLEGQFLVQDAVTTDAETGCRFLAPGTVEGSPAEALRSTSMRHLLARLSLDYQLVVLDSPPVKSVSDALILSRLADSTVYLVRWGRTPKGAALSGLKAIHEAGANVSGVMLTRANLRKLKGYEDSGEGTYYGLYGS